MSSKTFRNIMRALNDPLFDDRLSAIEGYYAYQTIKYSGKLRFLDEGHRVAVFTRHQRIRFIENGVGIFFDRVWGDGVLFGGYAAPGLRMLEPIRSASGYVLPLALPRLYNRGETSDIITHRKTIGAFHEDRGYWELAIGSPVDLMTLTVATKSERLRDPQIIAPPRGDFHAESSSRSVRFRATRTEPYLPYRLDWSWK